MKILKYFNHLFNKKYKILQKKCNKKLINFKRNSKKWSKMYLFYKNLNLHMKILKLNKNKNTIIKVNKNL
jgi:hypothetical protein